MPEIIKLEKLKEKKIVKAIKEGKIIVYPTDTIYGIGCDAKNPDSVIKLRTIKNRDAEKPLSIIAPSRDWIYKNFEVNKAYIKKLPGPFTFILRTKKDKLVSHHVTTNSNILGIRIPNHKFTKLLQKAKTPFVSTSVNFSGKKPINDINKIPKRILKGIDIIIDGGKLENRPSTIIDLTGNIARIIQR